MDAMADDTTPGESSTPEGDPATRPAVVTRDRRSERYFLIVPALAFVIGVLLGGVVVAATGLGVSSNDGTTAAGGASSSPSPTETGASATTSTSSDVVVTVPGECLQLSDESQQLLDLIDQAVQAARDLDATKLSGIVSQLQQAQQQLRTQTDACRAAATTS
jgi:hypothetical protein